MSSGDDAERDRQQRAAPPPKSPTSIDRLMKLLKPCSGTSLMLMIGMPSRSSSRARSAMTCSRSGTTLTSIISRPIASSSCEHAHVLFGGSAT